MASIDASIFALRLCIFNFVDHWFFDDNSINHFGFQEILKGS